MSNDDRLDRLEAMIETLVTTVTGVHNDLLDIARTNAADHTEFRQIMRRSAAEQAEYRQDIRRLYQAFSDHYREHGGQ